MPHDAWRLIDADTPRDGSEIILGEPGWAGSGFWSTVENRRSWSSDEGNWFAEMDRGNEAVAKPISATHWQAMPEPPLMGGDDAQ